MEKGSRASRVVEHDVRHPEQRTRQPDDARVGILERIPGQILVRPQLQHVSTRPDRGVSVCTDRCNMPHWLACPIDTCQWGTASRPMPH